VREPDHRERDHDDRDLDGLGGVDGAQCGEEDEQQDDRPARRPECLPQGVERMVFAVAEVEEVWSAQRGLS
jgi:hypothetical protein